MSDLTDFLLARISEDEEPARDAHYEGQRWVPEEESVVSLDRDLDVVMTLDRKRDAWFAANWSPARVLAECAAKRGIIRRAAINGDDWGDGYDAAIEDVLRDLANIYGNHPDYREEWRP